MRFAFFSYDMMLPALGRLLAEGHDLAAVFTFYGHPDESAGLRTLAARRGAALHVEKPTAADIAALEDRGVEVFLVAGYPWRVPVPHRALAANFHPSLLPAGRGIMPLPHIILGAPQGAGATLHVLERGFDTGPIIAQAPLPLTPADDVDSLGARIATAAPEMLSTFMADPAGAIARARPQDESRASTFPLPTQAMRQIDWGEGWARCTARVRAFGHVGALAPIEGAAHIARHATGWAQEHALPPGAVFQRAGADATVAAAGGFVHLSAPERTE